MDNLIGIAATFLVLGGVGLILKYGQQIIICGIVAIIVLIAVFIALYFWKRATKSAALNLADERILFMLRGAHFEQKMANMFTALNYTTEVVGGANDGGN